MHLAHNFQRTVLNLTAVYYYYPAKYLGLDLTLIFLYLIVDYTRLLLGNCFHCFSLV